MTTTTTTPHDYDDDYGVPYVGVYVLTHNMAGYLSDDDTPYVVVDTPPNVISAYADELYDVVVSVVDSYPDDALDAAQTTPYVSVDIAQYAYNVRRASYVVKYYDADPAVMVDDVRADILARLQDNGAADSLYDVGAVGVYVDADDTPTYYYAVELVDDDVYADIVDAARIDPADHAAYPDDYAADIVGAVRSAADDAVYLTHVRLCDSTTCDIDAAYDYGDMTAAAHLLASATEVPSIVGVHLSAHDPADVLTSWSTISRAVSAPCDSCGAYTYPAADDVDPADPDSVIDAYDDVETTCTNCRVDAVHVPTYVYAVRVDDHDAYMSTTTYVRARPPYDADDVAEYAADMVGARIDDADHDADYYGVPYVDVDRYDHVDDPARRYHTIGASYAVTTTYDMRDHADAADYAADDYVLTSTIDVHVRRIDVDPADPAYGVDRYNGVLRGITAHDVYTVRRRLDDDIDHDAAVHVYDVDPYDDDDVRY